MYGVLSSESLANSMSVMVKYQSHKKMLNKRGPKIDPWGIPNEVVC